MGNILQIAYTVEGETDKRFLGNIIEKTFESLLLESKTEIEIHRPVCVDVKKETFIERIKEIALKYNYFHVICVHCDSDAPSTRRVIERKINPAFNSVYNTKNTCNNLVAVIPVQMTEAWMLADIDLFLKEINTGKTCVELNLPCHARQVESIANPKNRIETALREAHSNVSRRRRRLRLSDLYTPVSQKLTMEKLEELPSFIEFKENARRSLMKLNYLH